MNYVVFLKYGETITLIRMVVLIGMFIDIRSLRISFGINRGSFDLDFRTVKT
jgi:hypothetical protein